MRLERTGGTKWQNKDRDGDDDEYDDAYDDDDNDDDDNAPAAAAAAVAATADIRRTAAGVLSYLVTTAAAAARGGAGGRGRERVRECSTHFSCVFCEVFRESFFFGMNETFDSKKLLYALSLSLTAERRRKRTTILSPRRFRFLLLLLD